MYLQIMYRHLTVTRCLEGFEKRQPREFRRSWNHSSSSDATSTDMPAASETADTQCSTNESEESVSPAVEAQSSLADAASHVEEEGEKKMDNTGQEDVRVVPAVEECATSDGDGEARNVTESAEATLKDDDACGLCTGSLGGNASPDCSNSSPSSSPSSSIAVNGYEGKLSNVTHQAHSGNCHVVVDQDDSCNQSLSASDPVTPSSGPHPPAEEESSSSSDSESQEVAKPEDLEWQRRERNISEDSEEDHDDTDQESGYSSDQAGVEEHEEEVEELEEVELNGNAIKEFGQVPGNDNE